MEKKMETSKSSKGLGVKTFKFMHAPFKMMSSKTKIIILLVYKHDKLSIYF